MTAIQIERGSLAETTRTIDVWAGCSHPLTRAEELLLASTPFMRLRRLRQMGLAFHAWPNAENTRASHSLGVAYWSARYLEALRRSADPATQAGVAAADASLDGLSLDVVLRLFGLLHDIDLLPLGHTLRYQSGLFGEGPGHPRLAGCVAAIKADAGAGPAFNDHLDAAAEALAGGDSPHGRLMTELVNSGLGADLVDFALRDSFAITRPQQLHTDLVGALRLVDSGLALEASPVHVAIADDLYLARYEVFAASVFHPVKLAADAMLDQILRRLGPDACRALLPEEKLLAMGDDELLALVAGAETDLGAGRLHEEVWRTEDLAAFRRRPDAPPALELAAGWRDGAEAALRERLPWAVPGDVIVAVSQPTMQAKPANARFVGPAGVVFDLASADAHGFATRAADTAGRYQQLWSLRVYLTPRRRDRAAETAAAAAAGLFA